MQLGGCGGNYKAATCKKRPSKGCKGCFSHDATTSANLMNVCLGLGLTLLDLRIARFARFCAVCALCAQSCWRFVGAVSALLALF
jgi:hypothetical protein